MGGESVETVINIQKAIDYVEDNILNDLNYDVIARQAYMSSYHFQRLFSMICGIPLGDYIRNRRLSLAGAEIKSSNAKIINIAFKYGYETPESFSRAFSRFHNIAPMMARHDGEIKTIARITIKSILEGMNLMQERIKQRGYTVGNVGSVYLSSDMDKTVKWFEDVLGWYAEVEVRDVDGNPTYGCAMPFDGELVHLGVTSFNGIFLLPGETPQCLISMMGVKGIDNLYSHVKNNGWANITEVSTESWGAKACNITTIDGCTLRFFESI